MRTTSRAYFTRPVGPHKADLTSQLQRFGEVEELPPTTKAPFSRDDEAAHDQVRKSLIQRDGHYEVSLPWKEEKDLPNSYAQALKRLGNTEARLRRDAHVAKTYSETIVKYVLKGYIRKVPKEEAQPTVQWFLPHFPVVRPEKSTTKTRIVFDASASFQQVALND